MISTARSISVLRHRQRRGDAEAVRVRLRADDVHREAALVALAGHRGAERVGGRPGLAILDQLEPDEEAAAAHVADRLVLRLELPQAGEHVLAAGRRALDQALLGDHVEHREAGRGGQRVGDVRGDVEEALVVTVLLDRARRDGRRERQAAAERLRDADEVGHHTVVLEAEHRPEAAEARLGLVHQEQHPALVEQLAHPAEVAVGRDDDAAGREHGLDDERAERADRLLVDELEADLEARAVAGPVAVAHRAAVGVRRRDGERPRQARARSPRAPSRSSPTRSRRGARGSCA